MQLRDKALIITGASSGIGAAAARSFAAQGARLVLSARRETQLAAISAEINSSGGTAGFHAGDVGEESCAAGLVELAETQFGGLDGAFNNAGIVGDLSPLPEMTAQTWQDVIATNLTAAFLAAKHQIPALQRAGGGALVFTSSFVGNTRAGPHGMSAYAASKAGLGGLVKALAAEHGADGIRVNALLPGGTLTPMAGSDASVHAGIAALHPLNRMAEPGEIANAAAFLLSDLASFVTGASLLADGGMSARF